MDSDEHEASEVRRLLSIAGNELESACEDLALRSMVIRKERAVGLVPGGAEGQQIESYHFEFVCRGREFKNLFFFGCQYSHLSITVLKSIGSNKDILFFWFSSSGRKKRPTGSGTSTMKPEILEEVFYRVHEAIRSAGRLQFW